MSVRDVDAVRAVVIRRDEQKQLSVGFEELALSDLPDYDVTIGVSHSTLNYKDGMALTGAKIARRFPMVAGIDLAGEVIESRSPAWSVGDKVIVNGYGLSETEWGGYSTVQRVKSEWLVSVPETLTLEEAMALGTAGYTAMLCVQALLDRGLTKDDGPVVVTGATGGVGSVAITLLSELGFEVTAISGKLDQHPYLTKLGATTIITRGDFLANPSFLGAERWAGAIDCLGGEALAVILSQMKYGASVAACGLAADFQLTTSVYPFILRNVSLLGIDSVMASQEKRNGAWQNLGKLISRVKLATIYQVVEFEEVFDYARKIIAGKLKGRVVVRINPN